MTAVCTACQRNLLDSDGCDLTTIVIDGTVYDRIPYGTDIDLYPHERCNDCGAARGFAHHRFCDNEICPACGGQLVSCGCRPDWLPGNVREGGR